MRFGRGKAQAPQPVTLPGRGETVVLSTSGGGRIPARVMEQGADGLLLAITVPTSPLTPAQLEALLLEYHSPRGRIRLQGSFSIDDPGDPDVVRLSAPRAQEVLQERSYVRYEVARPVVVFGAGGQMQSFTVDISGGGFQLAGPDTLKIGDEVSFQLTLSQGAPAVKGTARVVRTTPQGRRALEFDSISEGDRRRVVRFIFECQRDERRRGLGREQ
ncbi:MAG: flagellar brake protein [Solirubrobacteraceae bacterium]